MFLVYEDDVGTIFLNGYKGEHGEKKSNDKGC